MAKANIIGTEYFSDSANERWSAEVYIDKKTRLFHIYVPAHIAQASMPTDRVGDIIRDDSYEKVVTQARSLWKTYLLAAVVNTKVIRYKLATSNNQLIRTDHGIGISFQVGYRIDMGDNSFFCERTYAEYKEHPMNRQLEKIEQHSIFERSNHWVYKDWTQDLEKFFESTVEALDALEQRVSDFFGEDGQNLLDSIESGPKLLS